MAELITPIMRKSIKKMAEISQVARALNLMPSPEDFALRFIGDLKIIGGMVNRISTRINDILERYSNIPGDFLLKGFDELLHAIDYVDDYTKFAIKETADVMSGVVGGAQNAVNAIGSAASATTSAILQVGGGAAYGAVAMSANFALAITGDGRRAMTNEVVQDAVDGIVPMDGMAGEFEKRIENKVGDVDNAADLIKDWTKKAATDSVDVIDNTFEKGSNGIDKALEWIDDTKDSADKIVDNSIGVVSEKVENAKKEVEEKIEMVRRVFDTFTKNFDEHFGFINGKNFVEEAFRNASNTAYEKMESPVFDAVGELTGEVADFIKNFNIGKVVTAMGGLVIGAGSATLVMDLLPTIDVDRMLKDIIGGVDTYRIDKLTELYYNKYYENGIDLLEEQDGMWRLSIDDLEKYNADGYEKYLEDFQDINDITRTNILSMLESATGVSDIKSASEANRAEMNNVEIKSALKAMRKVRRDAIKAKQVERYKGFLKIELDNLKGECLNIKTSIKNEWDSMMYQYKEACEQIKKFFTTDGSGGNDAIDRCCDRINDDATQIVDLCKDITTELVSAIAMVPTPYAIGTCVDMPVHKILAYFKDIKIIVTFLRNLIRLGIDIISQLTILVKLICNGIQSAKEIMDALKKLIGVDKILNMINFLVELFRPKMIDAKILLENAISPIYYNETEEYEERVTAIEAMLEDGVEGGNVETFRYTEDMYAKGDKNYTTTFGGACADDEAIEAVLEELEAKGEREIVAYRSPILNKEGDDFAGWIFYHADAYDDMNTKWKDWKKRTRNKLIKKASKKNKLVMGKLVGGVAQLKKNNSFGHYNESGEYIKFSVNGFDAYYWYTKWTNDPTDCDPDMSNIEGRDVVVPVQKTSNGSMVELSDGRRVFVEGTSIKSGDFVNVNGVKYQVK